MNRRLFLGASAAAAGIRGFGQTATGPRPASRPNVVLIITDDQGYGDLSIHGNPHLKTPNIDRIAREGVQFTQFHVCPVCSPTRSSLMTGRYNYRTGVVDTFIGRSLMRPGETTAAEILGAAGYRTGIFGKWHLGDNYPMRPGDQGFSESVVIKGGGLGQPSDFPGGGAYTDPILLRNGKAERFKGYCTGIFVSEAIRFIEANRAGPFFVYLATNAPHTPLEIDEKYVDPFRKAGLDETTAKVYGMVANADENIGRLTQKLREWKLEQNTILIFMTDNGPQQPRFNAGMRGLKGTVYEGGTRVPFFLRWPAAAKAGNEVDRVAAHIDVLPTLLDACGVASPDGVKMDGRSLLPLIRKPDAPWPDRTVFTQWHRGDAPEAFRACAARTQKWKLVNGRELYDMEVDPAEARDVASGNPAVVAKLRSEYEAWFRDVSSQGYEPSRISLGSSRENPVMLTRQDWRGPNAGWDSKSEGYWEVQVEAPGEYEFSTRFAKAAANGVVRMKLNGAQLEKDIRAGDEEVSLGRAAVAAGPGRLEAAVQTAASTVGVHFVTVRRVRNIQE